jgi:hypothetical protein
MAEVRFNRLKGDVDRLERRIAYVNRGIKTSKKFAEGVDTPEKLRTESLAKLKVDEGIIKDLKEQLKEANKTLNDFVAEERAKKGKEKAKVIEGKYAKLQKSLELQLDPTSAAAEKIKEDMESLIGDYQGALTSINKRPTSIVSARAKLTGSSVPTFGETGKKTTAAKPTVITDVKTDQKPKTPTQSGATGGTIGSGTAGGTTGGNTGGTTSGANTSAFPQTGGVDTTTIAGITAASARPPVTGAETPLDTLLAKTEFWYDLPDYIFKVDPKLGELLVKAVNEGWDNKKFLSSAQLTPWWQKNAGSVREKIISREKYNDLLKSGEDVKNTEYGMYLSKQMRSVKAKAKELADVTLTDEQAQSVAQKIYDGNLEDDPLAINALIVPFIGRTTSIVGTGTKQTGFGGQALQNYQTLQGIAKANGFSLKDILPNISAITAGGDIETAVLRGLADGSIDINRVAQDARMLAAQGQPQYVRGLLGQGYDLEAIYAPYRQTMASVLEIQPDQIDLNDPTLRMGITDKGDMNLFDFKKALRQDSRWQYTGGAKEEVSNAALRVLQDFGFQG